MSRIHFRLGPLKLNAVITCPERAKGLVIFAHGSDSSYLSPRNELLAHRMRKVGLATLLFDFLSNAESSDRENSFRIKLLAERLTQVIRWTERQTELRQLPLGLFGSGIGVSAAIVCAAQNPDLIRTLVGRGARTEQALMSLRDVIQPSLFIVGELDKLSLSEYEAVIRIAMDNSELKIIPGASHLFSERGKLDEVAQIAADWFSRYLADSARGNTSSPPFRLS